ncbi:hypothetical protein J6590_095471 [Homalodisca vitripennis]|nr:hypothetical protein J6590_095471 [Homalodisca vitripennis]
MSEKCNSYTCYIVSKFRIELEVLPGRPCLSVKWKLNKIHPYCPSTRFSVNM